MPPRVLLHISATHLTLVRLARGGAAMRRHGIDRAGADETWSERIGALEAPLRRMIDELGCAGARALAVYDSPSATVEFQSTPTGERAARHAARLALQDSSSMTSADPVVVATLGRDRSGAPRRTHTLALSDDAACAQDVLDLMQRAGLKGAALAPVAAVTIADAAASALAVNDGEPIATLRIEDRYSTLAVSSHGRLHLLRLIDLGLDRMQEALTRPILRNGQELTLTELEARTMLQNYGVPDVDDVVDAARGLRGGDVLPLIQPVLQRLVVEVKQSLRFGLSEADRSRLKLQLEGAGAAAPGLGEIIADETGIALRAPSSCHESSGAEARRHVAIIERLNAMPPRAVKARMVRRARHGIVFGAALAVGLLSLDAAWNIWMTRSLDARLAALAPVTRQVDASIDRHAEAQAEFTKLRSAATAIVTEAPPKAHWGAWLAELSRATPIAVQLHSVSGTLGDGVPTVRLDGVASANDAEEAREAITHMLDSLRECPLVSAVTLDGVRRSDSGNDAAHAFSATVTLRTTPVALPAPTPKVAEVSHD